METFDTSWIRSYILKRPAEKLDSLTAASYWRYILMGSVPNPAFDPIRRGIRRFHEQSREEQARLIRGDGSRHREAEILDLNGRKRI